MKSWTKLGLAAALIAAPSLGLAQEEGPVAGVNASTDTVFILNSLLFLVGGFLVFWMAAGFAMLEAGCVRSKNTMYVVNNTARPDPLTLFTFSPLALLLACAHGKMATPRIH